MWKQDSDGNPANEKLTSSQFSEANALIQSSANNIYDFIKDLESFYQPPSDTIVMTTRAVMQYATRAVIREDFLLGPYHCYYIIDQEILQLIGI